MKIKLQVNGMHCNSCKMLIQDELEDMGAKDINITLDAASRKGTVECEIADKKAAVKAIESLGDYKVQ